MKSLTLESGRVARTLLVAVGVAAAASLFLVAVPPVDGQIFQATEDFTVDPMWDAFQTTVDNQNFGWSDGTNNAGGAAAGELGGAVIRTPQAYYAANIGSIDPSTTALLARGTAAFNATSGNVLVGWFDRMSNMAWGPPQNFIGFRTDDNRFIRVNFAGSDTSVENSMGQTLDGVSPGITLLAPFNYELNYDPTGGANNGGIFTATFSNVMIDGRTDNTYSVTIEPGESTRDSISDLNRHGLHNLFIEGNGSDTEFWLDDLEFTSDQPIIVNDFNWVGSGAGDWHTLANWDQFAPPSTNEHTAIFGGAIGQPSTVFTEQDITVKRVQFDNANSYGIAGISGVSLTLEADSGNPSVDGMQGSHEFQLPVNLASNTDASAATGATITFQNTLNLGGNTLSKTGDGTLLVNNNNTTGSGGTIDVQAGTLGGGGTVDGDLTSSSSGTVAPGTSAGLLQVVGNYMQGSSATLAIEIGGAMPEEDFDVLEVGGTADLAGTLAVSLIDGHMPALDDQFTVLTANEILGSLALGGQDGGSFSLSQVGNSLVLQFTGGGDGLTGDYNNDGVVNAADYTVWRNNLDSTSMLPNDPIGGTVGQAHYDQWKANYGNSGSGSGFAAVPEPSALALCSLALLGICGLMRTGGRTMRPARCAGLMLAVVVACATLTLGAVDTATAERFQRFEAFDAPPSGWSGLNNEGFGIDDHFFGWDSLNDAGGNAAGQIGGTTQTQTGGFPAYYADDTTDPNNPQGPLDPQTDVLTMSGNGINIGGNGQTFIGWFNSGGTLGPRVNADDSTNFVDFIGLTTDDDRLIMYANNRQMLISPRPGGGNPFTFSFTYDPNANGGLGAMMGTVNGGPVTTLNLEEGDKAAYTNTFDSFGLLANQSLSTNAGPRLTTFFWDDLFYTTSKEQVVITESSWGADVSADAASTGSWNPPVAPNSNGNTAIFGSAITQSRVAFTDEDLTIKSIQFDNANTYVLAGQGSINLEADSGNASITILQGSHEMRVPVSLSSDVDVTVPTGSTLTFDNLLDLNGFTLTKAGSGDLVINSLLVLDGGTINGTVINSAVIPEPVSAMLALFALGLVTFHTSRRR